MITSKQGYPFRLATTSFIYPADYLTNVRRLARRIDEVELLFFESSPDALPSESQIVELADAAKEFGLGYNVHLPLDLDITEKKAQNREQAVRRMVAVIRLVAPLQPTTHTLHLKHPSGSRDDADIAAWQSRALAGLRDLLALSGIDPRQFSIETLNYPPEYLVPIVAQMNMSVCLDVGHVLRYGFNLENVLALFSERISILHLHAWADGKDHRGLSRLDQQTRSTLRPFLTEFTGSVSIEVFSLEDLNESLPSLEQIMANRI
jgi:sugar phosphate isomerase/epimerase